MTIKLYNTKTKSKDVFEPLDAENVRMYVCGPTVYDRAHLGNARPVVVFDTLFRLLRHTYGADHVTYVRNFTDVDDKINAKAAETGRSIADITDETIGWYHDDMDALGALRPTQEPRATAFIPQMVSMIETLIEREHAYPDGAGHVLFAVRSYDEYGALARRSLDDMRAGARVEIADNKRDPMDFVLWKPSTQDQPGWDSPWGKGRPGWHIECSAMAYELLGESFDIHGGGIDLAFPHHENELAQSKCSHPEGDFARFWLHNEMLQVEGKKMSKSLGNFFTVRDLLEQGVPGEVIRFVFLQTHYSKPMDWTKNKRLEAEETLKDWYSKTEGVEVDTQGRWAFILYLMNDLDTSGALAAMHQLARDPLRYPELKYAMQWLGFGFPKGRTPDSFKVNSLTEELGSEVVGISWSGSLPPFVEKKLMAKAHLLSSLIKNAKETNDFGQVDELKSSLLECGIKTQMSKQTVRLEAGSEFDPTKLEALK